MAKPELSEVVEQFSDREWRLNNLYYIEDSYGAVIKFKLNDAQKQLLDDMHFLNIILKARQLGFSTFILLLALDCCIFNDHFAAGLIADTLPNAQKLLKRVKFAYDRMPEDIKRIVPILSNNTSQIEFANGSGIDVGVSLRSGTFNLLHISEYGKICAKAPDKAKEIKSGALNTLAKGQLGFIESTAEGRAGDFYEKTEIARKLHDSGIEPKDMEYKFHFFPWFKDKKYSTTDEVTKTAEEKAYFVSLEEEHGITLTEEQQNWYALKVREQGDDMWKEYPSTPEEAFKAAKDGAYWGKEMRKLRQLKRIGHFPIVPNIPVNTFWDFGLNDMQVIWFHQVVAGTHRFVGYYENNDEPLSHYFNVMEKWANQRGASWGIHYAPHDVEHKRQGLHSVETIKTMAAQAGYVFEPVTRSLNKQNSIMNARSKLMQCEFDDECGIGILHLEEYCREWDEKLGVWKSHPRHDVHSNGADGFITFADGFAPAPPPIPQFVPLQGVV